MTKRTICALAFAVALATPLSAQQKSASGKPAEANKTTAPAPLQSIPQLCRYRELEIVQYNRVIDQRILEMRAETNQAKTTSINNEINSLRGNLVFFEISWQRLNCSALIYGTVAK